MLLAAVYRNDGGGVFIDLGPDLPGVDAARPAWDDFDGDGDLDVLLAGDAASGPISRVYRNDGGGAFDGRGAACRESATARSPGATSTPTATPDILMAGDTGEGLPRRGSTATTAACSPTPRQALPGVRTRPRPGRTSTTTAISTSC